MVYGLGAGLIHDGWGAEAFVRGELRRAKVKLMPRGDVFKATLNPVLGSEQGNIRPVLIVSRDAINKSSPVVIAVPFTGLEN